MNYSVEELAGLICTGMTVIIHEGGYTTEVAHQGGRSYHVEITHEQEGLVFSGNLTDESPTEPHPFLGSVSKQNDIAAKILDRCNV